MPHYLSGALLCCLYFFFIEPAQAQRQLADTAAIHQLLRTAEARQRLSPDSAQGAVWRAYYLSRQQGYAKGVAQSQARIGTLELMRGKYAASAQWLDSAIQLSQQIGDSLTLAKAQHNLGMLYAQQGQPGQALQLLFKALDIYQHMNLPADAADCLMNMGMAHEERGEDEAAFDNYNKAQAIYIKTNNQSALSRVYNNMGVLYKNKKKYPQALQYYHLSLAIKEKQGDQRGYSNTLGNIAKVHRLKQEYAQALPLLQRALSMKQSINDHRGISMVLNDIGWNLLSLGQDSAALVHAQQALEVSQQNKVKDVELTSYNLLYHLLLRQHKHQAALQYAEKVIALKDTLYRADKERAVAQARARYDFAQQAIELKLLHSEREVQQLLEQKRRTQIDFLEKDLALTQKKAEAQHLQIALLQKEKQFQAKHLAEQQALNRLGQSEAERKNALLQAQAQQNKNLAIIRNILLTLVGLALALVATLIVTFRQQQRIAKLKTKKQLADIAHFNSHVVRAPVASMLGLIELLKMEDKADPTLLGHLEQSAHKLDGVIREIVKKTYENEQAPTSAPPNKGV